MPNSKTLADKAAAILWENDLGAYTVPTKGLYPFQWNWDSCLTSLGFAQIDETRGWKEMETLFAHQWPDGMVPHIVFHVHDDGYFPGPDIWCTNRPTPTSGITQPAVAGFAARRLYDRARDKTLAKAKAKALLPLIDRWHQWFFNNRDPEGEGLVAILHPWESGRDNSIDWDDALDRVPTEGIAPYTRRDLQHADADHRPTMAQYDRYLWLVERFRSLDWDNTKLHHASPFKVVDPGFNAILLRSCEDLGDLAAVLGEEEIAERNRGFAKRGLNALETLWSDRHGQYLCRDRATDALIDSRTVGGLLPAFAAIPPSRARDLACRIEKLAADSRYLVASHDPTDPRFDAKRYWRGPVWLVVNYMVADGLARAGETEMAERIGESSLALFETGGFAEYYHPKTGEPLGGSSFTWSAAMVLEFLREKKAA
ncbi:MAG: MGH1-like glycoside hydrolase domain-containing protein [Geminicoccales bacterium]